MEEEQQQKSGWMCYPSILIKLVFWCPTSSRFILHQPGLPRFEVLGGVGSQNVSLSVCEGSVCHYAVP